MTKKPKSYTATAIETALDAISFNDKGLVPAIAQQHDTGEVLMMAWMNKEAVVETLQNCRVCYYSRSRARLWRKGEESGQTQALTDFRIDCDGDTILLQVEQIGVACHTGRHNCFFNAIGEDGINVIADIEIDPEELYKK
jgi:phosphoribosyl-AMP cyclohydrolase